jgi:hypothetical protein
MGEDAERQMIIGRAAKAHRTPRSKYHDPIAGRRRLIGSYRCATSKERGLAWHERQFEFRTFLVQRFRRVEARRFESRLRMRGAAHGSLMSRTLRPRNLVAA